MRKILTALAICAALVSASAQDEGLRRLTPEETASLTAASKKGDREATLRLAENANLEYRTDEAADLLAKYRASLKKGRKVLADDLSGDLENRIERTASMLERVQKIEVIDSINVPAADFFRYFRLTPESGSLNAPDEVLPPEFEVAEQTVVYEPESRRQMIWSAPDSAGTYRLVSSSQLVGDLWESPLPLEGPLNGGGDANFPFLMPDGITLYYANDGEESLGGYDIFISRRDDDGSFLQPQNVGMPFNSPYNDYMLAVDELTGAGWWATDRNQVPGQVTVYIYIPQDLRVNVEADDPSLRQRALLEPLSATWGESRNYDSLRQRIAAISTDRKSSAPDFHFAINGRVLTSYSQLRTAQGRSLMRQYVKALSSQQADGRRLQQLRAAYGRGDRSAASQITALERSASRARADLLSLSNQIISLESR